MELPHIGKNCMVCNRNDYLPFKCSYCEMIVCVDHRTNHGNKCSLNELVFDKSNNVPPNESLKAACDYCKRKTLSLELVKCNHCSMKHCLYHRHQVQHQCPELAEAQTKADQSARSARQQEALDYLKTSLEGSNSKPTCSATKTKPTDPKKQQLARRIRIMKIKQGARGPPNVLEADKIFFEVRFKHEAKSLISNSQRENVLKIFTTRNHPVGRMVDWSADELNVINRNHLVGPDLLVFKKELDSGELLTLDSHKIFSHYMDGQTLENGDELILTYDVN